jgi:acetyl-CoA carboxylase carboxyltransferase component
MSWQPEIDELRRREKMARPMGGPDKIKRQHDGGKLTVRERIERLLDPGSFHEIGAIAGKAQYDAQGQLADLTASNFVMGRGRIDGRTVSVGGDDFTVRGGAADASIWEKQMLSEQMAGELGIPMVRLDGGKVGGRIGRDGELGLVGGLDAALEVRLNKVRSPFRTAERFGVEEIIDPRDTRPLLCEFANLAAPMRKPGPRSFGYRP